MEAVKIMKRSYERALMYGMKENDVNLGRSDERTIWVEWSGLYVACAGHATTMYITARTTDLNVLSSRTARLTSRLVQMFK